jgi:hypothetical protein
MSRQSETIKDSSSTAAVVEASFDLAFTRHDFVYPFTRTYDYNNLFSERFSHTLFIYFL